MSGVSSAQVRGRACWFQAHIPLLFGKADNIIFRALAHAQDVVASQSDDVVYNLFQISEKRL